LDGEEIGQTGPAGRIFVSGLEPGQHQVVARKEGYGSVSRTVTYDETGLDRTARFQLAERGDEPPPSPDPGTDPAFEATITAGDRIPDSIAPSFSPRPDAEGQQATLIVEAAVAGATVSVNDSTRGQTDRNGRLRVKVDPGQHRIAVRKGEHLAKQTTVQVANNDEQTLSINLQRSGFEKQPGTGFVFVLVLSFVGLFALLTGLVSVFGGSEGVFDRWFQKQRGLIRRAGHRLTSVFRNSASWNDTFDRYSLGRVLRRAESTTVHLAEDPVTDQKVRLKVLNDPYAEKDDHVQTFLEEGRALKRLLASIPEAPFADVYRGGREHGKDNGRPFLAMEPLLGTDLLHYLEKEETRPVEQEVKETIPVKQAILIIRQICVGLRVLHENDLHHGFLTPENVIVNRKAEAPEIKIIGFGAGMQQRATEFLREGSAGKTAPYLSPEQSYDGRVDWRSDIYAAGMLFYRIVEGIPPFSHENPLRVMQMHREAPRPNLPEHVPAPIKPIFYRMVHKNPKERPNAKKVISVLDLIQVTT